MPHPSKAIDLLSYDAWNRLIEVKDTGNNRIALYEYDGQNHRVSKYVTAGATTDDFYYNADWQILEVRRNGSANARERYVWDLSYIDTPIFREQDTNTDGTVDNTVYYTTDANNNVTGLYDPTGGTVQEYYLYDAYGRVQIYDHYWARRSSSAYDNNVLFCGYWLDGETGMYNVRGRQTLHPTLGRWGQRDPRGYVDGGSLYQYASSASVGRTDPRLCLKTVV